ncbi:outer membrane protein [Taklimakanibacter deserti]|uniref:outer membrane protein n=1 Tax=Taklimakanibacter deserti TaxID=2267839 RepID=UPI000E64B98D
MKTCLRGAAALAALAAFMGMSGAVQAADVEYSEPAYSWSGFYVGGYVGAGAAKARTELGADFGEIGGFDADLNGIGGDGFLGGALAGFNWQVSDRFVLGIQGDIGWTDIEADLDADPLINAKAGPDFIANASLRAGYLVTPDTLFYIIGGYSYAEFKLDGELFEAVDFDADQKYDGYHVGAGMETRLTDRLTARVEYRYTEFGSEDWDTDGFLDVKPTMHTGTLGLAYNLFPTAGEGEVATPTADVVEPQVSWTGFYVGANAGAGGTVDKLTLDVGGDDPSFDGIGGEGFLGSLMAGYNWQVSDSIVLGLQGDIGIADLKSKLDASAEFLGLEAELDAETKLEWFANASLRAGYLATPETMLYVIGGYSYAHVKQEAELTVGIPQGLIIDEDISEKQDLDGFHIGAGAEAMLTDSLTLRAEYRYTQYGKEDFFGIDGIESKLATHTGTVGIAWLFNGL